MALARVNDQKPEFTHHAQHGLDRRDAGSRQGNVVAHLVHVAPLAAKIGLHIDHDERRIFGSKIAAVGPSVGDAFDCQGHALDLPPALKCAESLCESRGKKAAGLLATVSEFESLANNTACFPYARSRLSLTSAQSRTLCCPFQSSAS